jgi:hypothetical protein
MRLDTTLIATMKAALIRANDDMTRATAQARALRQLMEPMSAAELTAATDVRDGTSYVQVVGATCAALEAMREAYLALHDTIVTRASGDPPAETVALRDK